MRLHSHEFIDLLLSLIDKVRNGNYLSGFVHFSNTDESSVSDVTYIVRDENDNQLSLNWYK